MSEKLETQASASCDVFDMDRTTAARPAEVRPAGDDEDKARKTDTAQKAASRSRIGPLHFAAASILLGAVWIFWPQSDTPMRNTVSNAGMLDTNMRGNGKTQSEFPAAARPTPTDAQRPAAGAASAVEETAGASSILLRDRILEQQAQQALALIATVDNLNARVTALEARPGLAAAAQPAVPASGAPPATPRRPATSARKAIGREALAPTSEPVLEGYALNTIYDGQAWIEHDQRIHVVREGDVIGGARVIRISARDHNVVTTHGVVR